jgi:preprotein translocase subunit SecG
MLCCARISAAVCTLLCAFLAALFAICAIILRILHGDSWNCNEDNPNAVSMGEGTYACRKKRARLLSLVHKRTTL